MTTLVRRIRWKLCGNRFVGNIFGNKSFGLFFEGLCNLTIKRCEVQSNFVLARELFRIIGLYIMKTINFSMPVSNRRRVAQSEGKFERPCEKVYCVRLVTKEG